MTTSSERRTTNNAGSAQGVSNPGMFVMAGCTIAATNYIAQARVLARSFKKYHPESPFTILVVDGGDACEQFDEDIHVLGLDDIGLEAGDLRLMPMIYNVTELSTAVKPWLLRTIRNSGARAVVYFDPDIEIFSALYDIAEIAENRSIVLTPHITEPLPRDGLKVSESDILAAGIYNLGFIAIGSGSERFLEWWSVRLRRECLVDPLRMRFTDQRWIDFVPGVFTHNVLRDPTCNVAYWNLHSRDVVWTGDRYEVNGKPLRFFHFSGFEPDRPGSLSKHQGNTPRILLTEHPVIAKLCDDYRRKLYAHGFAETKHNQYRFGHLSNGLRIDTLIRSLYRESLVVFENGQGAEPPNPFEPRGEKRFLDWLNEAMRLEGPQITRYMLAIHQSRGDLQLAFPNPLGTDAESFQRWFLQYGRHEMQAHDSLIPNVATGVFPNR